MGDITSIFIVGFIVLGIYKIFELLVRQKERLSFIEKFFTHCGDKKITDSFHLPDIAFGKRDSGSWWTLRISLLLIGMGIGCLLACYISYAVRKDKLPVEVWSICLFSLISVFGGLGLLTAYLIESKQNKRKIQ